MRHKLSDLMGEDFTQAVLLEKILDRVAPLAARACVSTERAEWALRIMVYHRNLGGLDLEKLYNMPLEPFVKDVFGIHSSFDRNNNRVLDFMPVCALGLVDRCPDTKDMFNG